MQTPQTSQGLVSQCIAGEILVYDARAHKVHRLTGVLASVFTACERGESLEGVAGRGEVQAALGELSRAGLLDRPEGLGRREALRAFGKAAVVPAVLSVLVPRPAYAQSVSCVVNGPAGCSLAGTPCVPCTDAATPDGQCATDVCVEVYQKTGSSCSDEFLGFSCLEPPTFPDSCDARAFAGPNDFYFCCGCVACP